MKRLQLFEFTDLARCPDVIRRLLTDYLTTYARLTRAHRPAVRPLAAQLRRLDTAAVLDLCSGAGWPLLDIRAELEQELGRPVEAVLTDLHPNREQIERLQRAAVPRVRYLPRPVSALRVPAELGGLRSMFNAFHHFRPADARQILQDAVDRRAGFVMVELVSRRLPAILFSLLVVPLLVLLLTPFIRPFRFWRLLLTYVIPVAPLTIAWDALVSCLRAYTPAELERMAASLSGPAYRWEVGVHRVAGLPLMHWLTGYPVEPGPG